MKKSLLPLVLALMLSSTVANAGTYLGIAFDYNYNWRATDPNIGGFSYHAGNWGIGQIMLGYSFNKYFGLNLLYLYDRSYNSTLTGIGITKDQFAFQGGGAALRFVLPVVPVYLSAGGGYGQARISTTISNVAQPAWTRNGYFWQATGGLQFNFPAVLSIFAGAGVMWNYADYSSIGTDANYTYRPVVKGEAGLLFNW